MPWLSPTPILRTVPMARFAIAARSLHFSQDHDVCASQVMTWQSAKRLGPRLALPDFGYF